MPVRRRIRGGLAALVAVAAMTGGLPGAASALAAPGTGTPSAAPQEIATLPSPVVAPFRADTLVMGGATGFLHREQGLPGYTWTDYASGDDTQVTVPAGFPTGTNPYPVGGDTLAYWTIGTATDPTELTVGDPATGVWTTYDLGTDHVADVGMSGTRALVRDAAGLLHLLQLNADGSTAEVALSGLPDASTATIGAGPQRVDPTTGSVALLSATPKSGGSPQAYLLQLDSGAAVAVPTGFLGGLGGSLSDGYLYQESTAGGVTTVQWFKVSDLLAGTATAPSTATFTLPNAGVVAFAGGHMLIQSIQGNETRQLLTLPLTGGSPTVVDQQLAFDNGVAVVAGAGGLLAVGGTSTSQSVQRFTDAADGSLATTVVRQLPAPSGATATLSMDYGQVRQVLSVPQLDGSTRFGMVTTPLAASSNSSAGTLGTGPAGGGYLYTAPGPCATDATCVRIVDGSTYGVATMSAAGTVDVGGLSRTFGAGATIVDSDDEFEIVDQGGNQYVWEPGQGAVDSKTVPVTGAALWQNTLWRTSGAGTVQALALSTGLTSTPVVRTVSTGTSCAPTELQVSQHWLYWSCGSAGPAGVVDLTTNAQIPVAAGPVLLGDGFVVRHDAASGQLDMTDVHNDSVGATTTLATFPVAASVAGDDRHITWTVDRTSGDVAYADANNVVHVLTTGVPSSPVTVPMSGAAGVVYATNPSAIPWDFDAMASRPISSWRFVVNDTLTGQQVHVATGGATPTMFGIGWNGVADSTGKPAYDGQYSWQIWTTPADDPSAPATVAASGTVRLIEGKADFRSYNIYGTPDLMTILGTFQPGYAPGDGFAFEGDGRGWFVNQGKWNQWQIGSASWQVNAIVPFGDLNGDGINDTLVRTGTGTLLFYPGILQDLDETRSKPVSLGSGWNIYNQLVSVGDLNGDGHDDLVARDGSGNLWFFPGNGHGGFGARTWIGNGWGGFTKIVGVGDLNGDGVGDLLAVDTQGNLWRFYGTGHGAFAQRTLLGSGYGGYNAIVGIGDLDGNGHNDFVARDTHGYLWRFDGNGHGGFAPRVLIGGGWGVYSSVY